MKDLNTEQKLNLLDHLSALTQNSIFTLDLRDSTISWLNDKPEQRFGHAKNKKYPVAELLHPEDLEDYMQSIEFIRQLQGDALQMQDFRLQDAFGHYNWIRQRVNAKERDAAGQVSIALGIATNRNEQKTYEENLSLTMEKLLASTKMAALGEMSGGIAHEINNPLTVIQARSFQLLQMAEANSLDVSKVKQAADSIIRTADKITRIIKSLRSFAREGANDPFTLVPLKQIIDETLEFCRTRFYNNGVEVEVLDFDHDLEIECRVVQIEQVLLNLLNNAFDAVQALEEKWIRIAIVEREAEIDLVVMDSGVGIPENFADKIMAPFFTTKTKGQGTGLGLSISNEIIRSHHGAMSLDKNAKNTTFVVRLPRWQHPTETEG